MNKILKTIALVLIITNTNILFGQKSNDITFKELNYGISSAKKLYDKKLKKSPSGHHNTTEAKLKIIKTTDTIPAEVGAQFGIEYMLLSDINEVKEIKIEWIFPEKIVGTNGKKIKSLNYKINKSTNSYTYSNYTLEGENEVVPGEWTVVFYSNNREIFRRTFILIK